MERFWRSLKPIGYRDRLCCPKWITISGTCWFRQFPFSLSCYHHHLIEILPVFKAQHYLLSRYHACIHDSALSLVPLLMLLSPFENKISLVCHPQLFTGLEMMLYADPSQLRYAHRVYVSAVDIYARAKVSNDTLTCFIR